jgi:hypothetical protein
MKNKIYEIINEMENEIILNKDSISHLVKTRQKNINKSKAVLQKYKINTKELDYNLDDFINTAKKGKHNETDKQLHLLINKLRKELDKTNDSKTAKIILLNMIVYMLNYITYFLIRFVLIRFRVSITASNDVATIITSFIVSPITDEIALKVEESGGYQSSAFSKYGSRLVTGGIHNLIFAPLSPTSKNQLIITLSGILINKFKVLFLKDVDIPILNNVMGELRKGIGNCYLIIFKFIKLFGSLIPGGGTGR